MCGILVILGVESGGRSFRHTALQLSKRLRHRGPDWSGVYVHENCVMVHERLAIVDPVSGSQPLLSSDGSVALAVNGEIYNHEELRSHFRDTYKFSSESDCEVILPMWANDPSGSFVSQLRGMFAFVIYDSSSADFLAARDPLGIIPLYYGYGKDGSIWFASEMKAIVDHCGSYHQFPPGHYYNSRIEGDKFVKYFNPSWMDIVPPCHPFDLALLRTALTDSVRSHLMSDVPFGVLLSGGLDSSLIAAIAMRELKERNGGPLRSYAIGLAGSPDLAAAARAAAFIGTQHHNLTFSVQDGIDALSEVIYHLETFDVTTVRASTPMFLMARMIKATGVKMVLSGEGADEIFGGYLYFHKAPDRNEFHLETVRKLKSLHMFDCLRANKAMSAWGVEARVPFLDTDFLNFAMNIDPSEKMIVRGKKIEKHILRAAFDTPENPYLPREILWRQKEQFSDGVGYGWIDSLKEHAEKHVSDAMMDTANFRFQYNVPLTKEAFYYRQIFEMHFPHLAAIKTVPEGPSIACSSPVAIAWDASFQNRADPSGRAMIEIHESMIKPEDAFQKL
jgi:asparagine synthase (glutamine-hydrolysing)